MKLEGELARLAINGSERPQDAVLALCVAAVRVALACDRVDSTKPVPGVPFTREILDALVDAAWTAASQPKRKAGLC